MLLIMNKHFKFKKGIQDELRFWMYFKLGRKYKSVLEKNAL